LCKSLFYFFCERGRQIPTKFTQHVNLGPRCRKNASCTLAHFRFSRYGRSNFRAKIHISRLRWEWRLNFLGHFVPRVGSTSSTRDAGFGAKFGGQAPRTKISEFSARRVSPVLWPTFPLAFYAPLWVLPWRQETLGSGAKFRGQAPPDRNFGICGPTRLSCTLAHFFSCILSVLETAHKVLSKEKVLSPTTLPKWGSKIMGVWHIFSLTPYGACYPRSDCISLHFWGSR